MRAACRTLLSAGIRKPNHKPHQARRGEAVSGSLLQREALHAASSMQGSRSHTCAGSWWYFEYGLQKNAHKRAKTCP